MEEECGMMPYLEEIYDVVIVGAGHVGCEAALVSAGLGAEIIILAVGVDSIALMPCNPSIGGSSKGYLVRELDAPGGEMGKNIDRIFTWSKMLNEFKGPAIHSLRAQADKQDYSRHMRETLESTEHLAIRQAEVSEIMARGGKTGGVKAFSGAVYHAKAVVLCTGIYLEARCIYGDVSNPTGSSGLQAANHLIDSLKENGIEMFRLGIGTSAGADKRSVDFFKMEEQFGGSRVVPFSFSTNPDEIQREQVSCWLTYTNEDTHRTIKDNLDRSPLFSGAIEGAGPRYCPSIENRAVKFSDKNRHQTSAEPEGLYTNEVYSGGMSSSLPEDVQYVMYRTVPGLEKVKIVRNAYAIEYDYINAFQLKLTLKFKKISDLSAGGQFNGSSGYEEAAVQGFMVGVNAVMKIQRREAVVLDRSQAYIGVLIDSLVTEENHEPCRMITSRAEYGLLLRQDNADIRSRKIGYDIGLVSDEGYEHLLKKMDDIQSETKRLEKTVIGANGQARTFLKKYGSTLLRSGIILAELVKRPESDYDKLEELDEDRPRLPDDVRKQVSVEVKYEGHIKRQTQQVAQFRKLGGKKLPEDFDYSEVNSLRKETVQKLNTAQPVTIGQAPRVSGVPSADIFVLLVHFTRKQ